MGCCFQLNSGLFNFSSSTTAVEHQYNVPIIGVGEIYIDNLAILDSTKVYAIKINHSYPNDLLVRWNINGGELDIEIENQSGIAQAAQTITIVYREI